MKKCILIVIDSLGVGAAPDAFKYGDEESNTFGNVSRVNGELNLPTFNKLGFGRITEINGLDSEKYVATVGKLAEKSTGNDSTTGHWEIAGLISESEFSIFPNGFPEDLVNKVKSPGGTTEAGLNSLKNASFDTIIFEAIQKATQRSTEISKELTNE